MAGRPKRGEDVEVVFLRLPKDVLARVVRCTGMIEITQGVKLNKTEAFRRILEAGCEALEGTREGRETPAPAQMKLSGIAEISSMPIAKISDIAGDDMSIPGYGFPEDEDEIPAPVSHTNGTGAPAPQPTAQPAIPLALEPAPKTAHPVDVPQVSETPSTTVEPVPELSHDNNTVLQESEDILPPAMSDSAAAPGQTPLASDSRHYLGKLCPRGHDWEGTGQSLRSRKGKYCLECNRESQQAKRQGQPA
jgi:hypothetical protein